MKLRLGRLLVYPRARLRGAPPLPTAAPIETVEIEVPGLLCDLCARRVERALLAVPGVSGARVALDEGRAWALLDPALAEPAALVEAVQGAVLLPWARRLLASLGAPRFRGVPRRAALKRAP